MSNEYQDWLAEERWEEHQEQLQLNLSGTDEDLELWTVIMEISDFLQKRDVHELIDNLPRHVYDPIAKYVHNDYAKM